MAGRTNTDAIRELERLVAMLTERLDNAREDIQGIADNQGTSTEKTALEVKHLNEALADIRTQIALHDERLQSVSRTLERSEDRQWQIKLLVIGSLFTLLANIAIVVFQRYLT